MNNVVPVQPGARDGNWVWDGTRWICDPDCSPAPCPPSSILQPGGVLPPFFPPPVTQPPWYPGANGGVSFSPPGQPPPNPIRGAFWWDGSTLWMFDGAAWMPTGGAAGGSTTPPSSTAPANPQPGQQWFNGTTLFVWDGNAWVPVSQTKTYVQATAPPAPNPGDMWFDGTVLRIWSGSSWDLVGPGATVGPVPTTTRTFAIVQPGFTAAPTTWGIYAFTATPQIDLQSAWDPVSKKLTPKQAGVYLFEAAMWRSGNNDGIAVVKNDSGTFTDGQNDNVVGIIGSTVAGHLKVNGMISMNGTSDFVRLWVQTSAAQVWGGTAPPLLDAWLMP